MIQAEGVESLSESELREECRERGMLGLLSVEEMREQVQSRATEGSFWYYVKWFIKRIVIS